MGVFDRNCDDAYAVNDVYGTVRLSMSVSPGANGKVYLRQEGGLAGILSLASGTKNPLIRGMNGCERPET
jgi:hypothetical protein